MLKKFVRHPNRSSDVVAAERLRIGNCYEMARSVIWRAQQQGLPGAPRLISTKEAIISLPSSATICRIACVISTNCRKPGLPDPWAGIFAPAAEYEDRFVAKMNKWHQNNKIVCFKGDWMHANDPRWLNSVIGKFKAIEPISYRPVMSRAGPSTSSRSAGSCMESLC